MEAEAAFQSAGLRDPAHEARYLLGGHLGCSPAELFLRRDEGPPAAVVDRILSDIHRRARREPADHLIGWKEFRGRRFGVGPEVLIPRPETEGLVDRVVEDALRRFGQPIRILDVGTGSGCVAISAALEIETSEVTALDVSPDALLRAEDNARRLGVNSVRFLRSDLFAALGPDRRGFFDIIVSNPPYIPTDAIRTLEPELVFEPGVALDGGFDGLGVIRRIAAEAPAFLKPGGRLFLEIGFDQGKSVSDILSLRGFREVRVLKDLEGHDRIVTGDSIGPV